MTSKTAGLPMLMLDERRVVDAIAAQVAILLPKMRASHETLTSMLRERLRRGDLNITMKAVHAVEHEGDWLADSILRATYAEMRNRGEPMSIELQSFGLKAVLRPPLRRGRGRDRYAHWSRDAGICFLVLWACAEFGVKPTRSRGARRDRVPSGCSLVKRALERHKIFIEENSIQEHIWLGLPGTLMRHAAAERMRT